MTTQPPSNPTHKSPAGEPPTPTSPTRPPAPVVLIDGWPFYLPRRYAR